MKFRMLGQVLREYRGFYYSLVVALLFLSTAVVGFALGKPGLGAFGVVFMSFSLLVSWMLMILDRGDCLKSLWWVIVARSPVELREYQDGVHCSPAQAASYVGKYPEFARQVRSLRLGLAGPVRSEQEVALKLGVTCQLVRTVEAGLSPAFQQSNLSQ